MALTSPPELTPPAAAGPRWPAWMRRGAPPGRLGWRRVVLLRRIAAGVLVCTALVLALVPPRPVATVPVLVAAVDVAAGAPLRATDLLVRDWPAELVPTGALSAPPGAEGRSLVGA